MGTGDYESYEDGNPPGVNLAHALEAAGFKTGPCGELVGDSIAWCDVIETTIEKPIDLISELATRGFQYMSSEISQAHEDRVRIFAKQIPKLKIVTDTKIQFGSGSAQPDVAQEYMGKFAEHQHVWDDAPDGTLHCSVCGKPKVGLVVALTKDPAIEMFKEIMDKKLAKAMSMDCDASMEAVATASKQFEKMMGKHVGIDLAAGEDIGGFTISTDDGQNYTLNMNSLDKYEPKAAASHGPELLATYATSGLCDGGADEVVDSTNKFKMQVMRQMSTYLVCLAKEGEQILSMALNLGPGPHTLNALFAVNTDGSETYLLESDGTVVNSAQRAPKFKAPDMELFEAGQSTIAKIDSEFLIQFTDQGTGKPIISFTKDGKIVVNADYELYFNHKKVHKELAEMFWKAMAHHNPLHTENTALKAVNKSLADMLKKLKADAVLEKVERERAKLETRQQTRMRRILGEGFE